MAAGAMRGDTLYAPVERLEAWLAAAQPGDGMAYAVGPALDPGNPAAALVRGWIAAGLVITPKKRGQDELYHRVVRRALPEPPAPVAAHDRQQPGFGEWTPEGRLLAVLEELAAAGLPCPVNAKLAALAELRRGADDARFRLRKLCRAGLISVATYADGYSDARVVTICATGARTAVRSNGT